MKTTDKSCGKNLKSPVHGGLLFQIGLNSCQWVNQMSLGFELEETICSSNTEAWKEGMNQWEETPYTMSFSCYQENHFYAKLVWDQAYAIYLIGKQLLPFISQYSTHFHSHLCIKERDMVSLRIALNWVSFCEAMQLLINYSICWHLNHFCFHNKENLDFLLN